MLEKRNQIFFDLKNFQEFFELKKNYQGIILQTL